MEIYEYLALDNEEQWDVFWDMAVYLDSFKSVDCWFEVYALDKFFVEVELCPLQGTIIGKSIFVHGKRLDKYTGDIVLKKSAGD